MPARKMRENLRIRHPSEQLIDQSEISRLVGHLGLVNFDFESQEPREKIID